jgi:hypothetical protein
VTSVLFWLCIDVAVIALAFYAWMKHIELHHSAFATRHTLSVYLAGSGVGSQASLFVAFAGLGGVVTNLGRRLYLVRIFLLQPSSTINTFIAAYS